MSALFPFPAKKRQRTTAELHRTLIDALATMKIPEAVDPTEPPHARAACPRHDATYLGELHQLLQPIVKHVVERDAAEVGNRDLSDYASLPCEVLDDMILSAMKGRAAEIEEDEQDRARSPEAVGRRQTP